MRIFSAPKLAITLRTDSADSPDCLPIAYC